MQGMEEYSKVLRAWRKAHNYTIEAAANLMGVSTRTICFWEAGQRRPDPWRLYRMYLLGRPDVARCARDMLRAMGEEYAVP